MKFIFPITWMVALDVSAAHQLIPLLLVWNSETDAARLLSRFAAVTRCEWRGFLCYNLLPRSHAKVYRTGRSAIREYNRRTANILKSIWFFTFPHFLSCLLSKLFLFLMLNCSSSKLFDQILGSDSLQKPANLQNASTLCSHLFTSSPDFPHKGRSSGCRSLS